MTTIEGFVPYNQDRFYGMPGIRVLTIPFNDSKGDRRDKAATLIVWPDAPQKVFTQEPTEETRVELVPNNYDCMLTCSKCRDGVPYYLLEEFDDINFCPNCGRRINKAPHGLTSSDKVS